VSSRRSPRPAGRRRHELGQSFLADRVVVDRRDRPLVAVRQQRSYQAWIARVFSSRGRGLVGILTRNGVPSAMASEVAERRHRKATPLPRDLKADDWADLFEARK